MKIVLITLHWYYLGENPDIAAQKACDAMSVRVGGSAGAIVISKDGEIGIGFSSPKMAWAFLKNGIIHYGIKKGQRLTVEL